MFKIAYCAGHYLGTAGKRLPKELDKNETREWVLNDRVARYFAEAAGQYEGVELLRTDDPTGESLIDIPERCAAANEWGADIYIDMHHNGGANNTNAGGVVAYHRPDDADSEAYAKAIYEAVVAAGELRGNRASPIQERNWQTMKEAEMPAVLMEYGFMDSKKDTPVIVTEAYSKAVGYATMEAIAQVEGLKKKAPEPKEKLYRVQVGAFRNRAYAGEMLEDLKRAGFPGFIVEVEA
jgi:N-acetylmuramoyl-L-alanine amidase